MFYTPRVIKSIILSILCLVLAVASAVAQRTTVTPDPPVAGQSVTIHYNATGTTLAAANPVYIHLGWNGWSPTVSPDAAMTSVGTSLWDYTATVPATAVQLDCVFNNGAGTWDNNNNADWHFQFGVDISSYPLGATPAEAPLTGGVVFRVWAPNATATNLAGNFNGWSTTASPMAKNSSSIWSLYVPNATLGSEYKFVFTPTSGGVQWKIDPRARKTIEVTGNSVVASDGSTYDWLATSWQSPDFDRMVIYELHVGSFSGEGDSVGHYPGKYRDVVDAHMADLLALGVNVVEIMPLHEFPATSWGYNPVSFFAPETSYGNPDDLRYMIDKLHQNGIAVVLDVIYNHASNSDNNLWNFDGPQNAYFFGANCQGSTDWGDTRPKYTEAQVRSWITDNARYWIKEFKFDGLRVDSTVNMRGYCNEQGEGWLTMGDVTDAAKAENSRAIVIAEELPNTFVVTNPRSSGGAGYDAQWDDLWKNEYRGQLAAIGGGGSANIGSLANALNNTGAGVPKTKSIRYIESHDEAGNADRVSVLLDSANSSSAKALDLSRVATGITLLAPGIPMILQGEEFAESRRFGDGQGNRIRWSYLPARAPMRDFFGVLTRLRTSRGSLRAGSSIQVTHQNDGNDVIAFQRYDGAGDVTFVVANFGTSSFTSYLLGVPSTGTWHELANSQDPKYGGTGTVNGSKTATGTGRDGQPATLDVALPQRSLLVFSKTAVAAPAEKDAWTVR